MNRKSLTKKEYILKKLARVHLKRADRIREKWVKIHQNLVRKDRGE